MKSYLLLPVLVLLAGCGMASHGAMIGANEALADGRYDDALKEVNNAERYLEDPSPAFKRKAAMVRARAYEGKGDAKAARGMYEYLYDRFPESEEGYVAKRKLAK